MYRLTKSLILTAFLGVFLFGLNAYAHTQVDLSSLADKSAKLAVIEGKIKSIDLEKMEIVFEGNEFLGGKPLKLTKDTSCYMGNEETDIVSIRGGYEFKNEDELSFNQLSVGDYVKCNYSRRDGSVFAVRIVRILPQTTHILIE